MDGGAHGLLSDDPRENPDFHNWTMFHLNYCDGASFAGSGSATLGRADARCLCARQHQAATFA